MPASAKHADMGQLIGHAILCPLAVISDRMLCSVLLSDGETIKDSTRSSCTGQQSLFGVVSNFRPLSNSLVARDEVPQRSVSADATSDLATDARSDRPYLYFSQQPEGNQKLALTRQPKSKM